MALRYSDRFPRKEHPDCFGHSTYYEENSRRCNECHYADECFEEINNVEPNHTTNHTINHIEQKPEVLTRAAEFKEGQSPAERFFRDTLTGAVRGALYEAYDFFCRFRF
jgi:hypothetical protein